MEDKRIVSETPIDEYWKRSVKCIGIPILLLAMAASFFPFLYMCLFHDAVPAFSNLLASWGGIAYIAPAIFGAVFAMFSESKPKLAFPAFIGAFGLNFLVKYEVIAVPSWGTLIICVAGVVILARALYKMGRLE